MQPALVDQPARRRCAKVCATDAALSRDRL